MAKIFGIDLGTTYSCIAYVDEFGKPVVVNNQDSSPVTPSVVAFEEGGGYSAGEAAKGTLESEPDHVCSVIKRHMGSRDYTFEAFGKEWQPEEVSALILQKITKDASEVLGEEVKNVVITCPAYFGMEEREATQKAGEIADLNVISILNEPTAAAISYGLKLDTTQTVMVFDLGGGTFDVTIIKVENGRIETIATGGDHMLGGKDWDAAIRDYVIESYAAQTGESVDSIYDDKEIMGDLELKAEQAKKTLTPEEKTKAIVKLNGEKIEITREIFNEKTRELLESTIVKTRETMAEAAKKNVTHYDKILLVGGSTRMLQIKERLTQEFPDTPIEFCDPDQSVAKGAAIYGLNMAAFSQAITSGEDSNTERTTSITEEEKKELQNNPLFRFGGGQAKAIEIVNVISQSVAVKLVCDDDQEHIINQIFKNTAIPCTHELHAGTHVANQTSVQIEIYENGSSETMVEEESCRLLVEGELGPLPEGLPANAPIDVIFNIHEDGQLTIDAEHKPSGAKKHLEVSLVNSLTKQEVEEAKQKVKAMKMI